MNHYTFLIITQSILIPTVIGWVRYKKINPAFYPFLWLLTIGWVTEAVSEFVIDKGYYNIVPLNLYFLAESLITVWLFRHWHLFATRKIYYALLGLFLVAWLAENIFRTGFTKDFDSYFHIFYAFIIVLMSVAMINRLLMKERGSILKNPMFLICTAFILFFTLSVLTEAFLSYGVVVSAAFQINVNNINRVANLLCYFIYSLAIIWMPKRLAFSVQY